MKWFDLFNASIPFVTMAVAFEIESSANVLANPQAIEMGIYVVHAFVQLHQATVTHADLAQRQADLEMKVEGMGIKTDAFAHNTRNQLRQIFEALRGPGSP